MGTVLLASCVVLLANPAYLDGALYPFRIFGRYSYRVLENQSINFLSNLGVGNQYVFYAYWALLGLVLASYAVAAFANWKKISLTMLLYSVVFGGMGMVAIRDFPLFGLIALLAVAMNMGIVYASESSSVSFFRNETLVLVASAILIMTGALFTAGFVANRAGTFGIGIETQTSAAAFFKENNLSGPIFNNYDIGGYLIYSLFPDEKVYFDNRPEAYSSHFVDDNYIAAMEKPDVFTTLDGKYKFNTIVFYYKDYTPWGQAFITQKVFDKEWAPVYVDSSVLILMKRTRENRSVIEKYEIPQEYFRISR